MEKFSIHNFGPIGVADVNLGDLTILVGPQASGKSLFLEVFKLAIDVDPVCRGLLKYNYALPDIKRGTPNMWKELLDLYLGNGLGALYRENTRFDESDDLQSLSPFRRRGSKSSTLPEHVFYIPAQRILSIADGRFKAFSEYDPTTPYVIKQFSETMRAFVSQYFNGVGQQIFPLAGYLEDAMKESFDSAIFHGGKVSMQNLFGQLKMLLEVDGVQMPFMTWSAGQKEFMPMLLAFYYLSTPFVPGLGANDYRYVAIEEPEMGLHPEALKAVLLQVFKLMQDGKKVFISTHSTIPMEFAWAFNQLKSAKGDRNAKELDLLRLLTGNPGMMSQRIFENILEKEVKTYFFSRKGENGKVTAVDISSLDAWDENEDVSEWGGLSSFASQAGELVSKYHQEGEP